MAFTRIGAFGGNGGYEWDDGSYSDIKQIHISSGMVLDSIQIEYSLNGSSVWSSKHGGDGGNKHMIKLNYPYEFITEISGHLGYFDGSQSVVQSLMIRTNLNCYGPYGTQQGDYFSVPSNGGKIVGFFGKAGNVIDAIGAYVMRTPTMKTVGPFGGHSGNSWDDGVNTKINMIEIHAGEIIDSFRINYIKDGETKWTGKRGYSEGGQKSVIKLGSNEYITSISGYFRSFMSFNYLVSSLTIKTNQETYGPFGQQGGTPFEISGGKIVGLFGKSGEFVDSLGAYVV